MTTRTITIRVPAYRVTRPLPLPASFILPSKLISPADPSLDDCLTPDSRYL